MNRVPDAAALAALAVAAGFQRAAVVDPTRLTPSAERLRFLQQAGRLAHPAIEARELSGVLPGLLAGSTTILVALLSCHRLEPEDPSIPGEPQGLVAPFARRHYYHAAVRLLRGVARRAARQAGVAPSSIRLLSNSRVPEKPMAVAAGLAAWGANSLVIAPGLGSEFVIALAVFPFAAPPAQLQDLPDPCAGCRRCVDACPVGAIVEHGFVDPGRCLQGYAGRAVQLPVEQRDAWGLRLYGCQTCQAVCPHNRDLPEGPPVSDGEVGPGVPLAAVLDAGPSGVQQLLRDSALGMRWISGEALVRNAILAAGHRGDPAVRRSLARYLDGPSMLLAEAAAWAMQRLGSR